MRRTYGLGMLVAAVGLAAASVDCVAQAAPIPSDIQESIRARVDHEYNAAIVVGVVDPGGTRYFAYGRTALPDGPTPDEHTVFEIGSITKVFTSILLAEMVERGEVTLEDPIERYLPEGVTAPTRGGRSITLVDLATQTSGLPRLPSNFAPTDPGNPYADYTPDQLYAFLSGHTLRRDIGAAYEYSNLGVGLLGQLLARRAARDYEPLVVERIADPLDMTDTRITLTAEMRSRLAQGHAGTTPVPNWDIPTLAGAGALRSTASDMLVFLAANVGLTDSPLHSAMAMTHEPRHDAGSATMRIGLGWHIREGDREVVWHNGGTGGYRAFAGFERSTRTGVVVLTNTSTSADDIGFHLLDPTVPLREIRVPVAVDSTVLRRYVGTYELRPGVVADVGLEQGRLTVQLVGQPRFRLYAASERIFFLTVVDAEVTFLQDETGTTTGFVLKQGGIEQTAKRVP